MEGIMVKKKEMKGEAKEEKQFWDLSTRHESLCYVSATNSSNSSKSKLYDYEVASLPIYACVKAAPT
jgi:hypothetical protein